MRERNPTLCNSDLFILLRGTPALCSVGGVGSDGLLCEMLTLEQGFSEWSHSVNGTLRLYKARNLITVYLPVFFFLFPSLHAMLPLSNYNGSLKMLQWIRPPPAGLGGQWMSGRSTGVFCRKSLASVLHSSWHCHLLEWCLMGFFNKTQNTESESLIYANHQG